VESENLNKKGYLNWRLSKRIPWY